MKKLTWFVLFQLLIFDIGFAQANPCLSFFEESADPYFAFEDKSYDLTKAINPVEQVFLAKGFTSSVYIIRDAENPNRKMVKKIYAQDSYGTDRYHFDVEALVELKGLLQTHPTQTFTISAGQRLLERVEGYSLPLLTAQMPYVIGRNVHNVLVDAQVSLSVKERIKSYFKKYLLNLKSSLAKAEVKNIEEVAAETRFFYDEKLDELPMLRGELKKGGKIIIKTDNVIVDPFNLSKMTLVDPY